MNELLAVIGIVGAGLLGGLWALFQRKLKKALSRAEEAELRASKAELRQKIGETAAKTKDDILVGQKERREQKDAVDQKITESSKKEEPDEKREAQQEIVDRIADLFNTHGTAH